MNVFEYEGPGHKQSGKSRTFVAVVIDIAQVEVVAVKRVKNVLYYCFRLK